MARCDSSFVAVPYRTPSASPDRPATHSKPAMTAVVAAPPAATTVHNAAPPSPPLGPISALALFAAEMFVWLWFAPTSGGAGAGEAATPEDGAGLARLQVKPTDRFLRFCHEILSTSKPQSLRWRRERGAQGGLRTREPSGGTAGSRRDFLRATPGSDGIRCARERCTG